MTDKKIKIVVAGIGGVGGYFGGLLAKKYEKSENVEICFVARGEHLSRIQDNGLTVIQGKESFLARPALATNNPTEIGTADYLIIATKSYDLESAVQHLLPCIGIKTVVLPLLNGVDSVERIRKILPQTEVASGCVYIVSHIQAPGVVENSGNIQSLYFGHDGHSTEALIVLEQILLKAGIQAVLSQSISKIVWEKYLFIAPTATATSYFNTSIGGLLEDARMRADLIELVEELKRVATAKGIVLDNDITDKTIQKLASLPFETTSSMHRDFLSKKGHSELQSLTGYVVDAGQELGDFHAWV